MRRIISAAIAILTCITVIMIVPISCQAANGTLANLTEAERAVVDASKVTPIRVGVIENSAPLFYYDDESMQYVGIAIEMLNLVSKKTGMCFEYVPVDLSRRNDVMNPTDSSPLIVIGVPIVYGIPDDRSWLFSDSLASETLTFVGRLGTDIVSESSDKEVIAVMSNFAMSRSYAELNFPEASIKEYASLEECMAAVADGEATAAVYLQSCIKYLLQKPYYSELEIITSYSAKTDICAAGFVSAAKTPISVVNKGLALISDKDVQEVTLNFTLMNPYKLTKADVLYRYRLPIIIIVVLLVVVIISLIALVIIKRNGENKLKIAYIKEQQAHEKETEALELAKKASAAKGEFMSRMSHEIRTPLNAIIGYNTIARNTLTEAKTDNERRQANMNVMDCLTKCDVASSHLLTIINDVLDMSAIENGRIKVAHDRFDFKALINSLTLLFFSQARAKGVELEVMFDNPTEEWFVGDRMRINQILTNLLSNAVKFTHTGGHVNMKIMQSIVDDKTTMCHFVITDTGIGMSKEYLSHIWTPFEQADDSISRNYGGTGLGLSITKSLVELMHGTIDVKSELGKGTVFTVNLALERTTQPEVDDSYDFTNINALIVDDDKGTCDYIKLLFDRCGAQCMSVTSGNAAIEAFAEANEANKPFTICLIDWRMPEMDGLETIKRLRKMAGNDLPIIVITAYDYSEISSEAEEIGVNMFISKPLFQSSLFDLLANICGRPLSSRGSRSAKYDFGGARVLLAEDNKMNMEIAKRIMEAANIVVDCAWNGQEAIDAFMQSKGTYKAILMDVHMPIVDGYQATKAIRASDHPEAATIPIIAMTADAFAEDVVIASNAGMDAHIAKPISVQVLFDTLANYILQK